MSDDVTRLAEVLAATYRFHSERHDFAVDVAETVLASEWLAERDAARIAATESDETRVAEVLAEHRYRDLLGDYEIAPHYKHFGCSCGWEQNIAGMNGYWSWLAAFEAHVAQHIAPLIAEARLLGATQAKSDAIDAHAELVARMEALADEFRDTDPIPGRAVAGLIRAALNDPTEETP